MNSLDIKEIEKILPHRRPFLLVDYVEDYVPGLYATGYKCVSYNEDFFSGHFPEDPVMPGVLIIEAMGQIGAISLLSMEENRGRIAVMGGIENCRIKSRVVPGDKLRLEARVNRVKGPVGSGIVKASVDGRLVARGEIIFKVI